MPRRSSARVPRSVLARLGTVSALLFAGIACQSSQAEECARPEYADRGWRNATAEVQRVVRLRLFDSAFMALAERGGREPDAGSRAVRRRLRRADVDPATTTLSTFRTRPAYGAMWPAATGEGPLARQVSTVMLRLQATVHGAAARLPAKDMIAWRDDLGRRTRDAAAAAFFADPTYRAGFSAGHPRWDGTIGAMRGDPANQDLVNTLGHGIVTAIEESLTPPCAR